MKRRHALLAVTAVLGSVALISRERHGPDIAIAMPPPRTNVAAGANSPTMPLTVDRSASSSEINERVAQQYGPLLLNLDDQGRARVQELLQARESSKDVLSATEHERLISLTLSEENYALYERLRESAPARDRLAAITQQVAIIAPLTEQQQSDLLVAMLDHDGQLQRWELQRDVVGTELPEMQAEYVRDIASQGLDHHRRAFLESARSILSVEQWNALSETPWGKPE